MKYKYNINQYNIYYSNYSNINDIVKKKRYKRNKYYFDLKLKILIKK